MVFPRKYKKKNSSHFRLRANTEMADFCARHNEPTTNCERDNKSLSVSLTFGSTLPVLPNGPITEHKRAISNVATDRPFRTKHNAYYTCILVN